MNVGVLGGGQLGRMLALAGIPLGMRFRFLEPASNPCGGAVGDVVQRPYDDADAWGVFAKDLSVVTYEFENVVVETARALGDWAPVFPPPEALAMAQDRWVEKATFRDLGIGTAPFTRVDSPEDVEDAVSSLGLPLVLKTRRMGYDGKGQAVVRSLEEARSAAPTLGSSEGPWGLIAEGFVPFDRELSILAVSGRDGERAFYPVTENHHREGILRVSFAPAPGLTEELQRRAEELAVRVLDRLEYVGVLAIELFQVGEELLANEVAPRVHNSGHWTQDGAATSQFENHLRAIAGLPLGSTEAPLPSAMVNLIGSAPTPEAVLQVPGARLHLYDKAPRPGRKIGHVNVVGASWEIVAERVAALEAILPEGNPLPRPALAQ